MRAYIENPDTWHQGFCFFFKFVARQIIPDCRHAGNCIKV